MLLRKTISLTDVQLEGWPAMPGTDVLTVQSNLLPLSMLGQQAASGGTGANIAQ